VPPPIPDLDGYRSDAERFLEAPGPAADAAFAHLFSADAVSGLEAYDGGDPRRMRALARFAAEGHLRLSSADEMAGVHELLRAPLVAGGPGGAVTLGEVDALLAAEPDRERRREIQRARLRALDQHLRAPLSDAALRRADAARALGAASAAGLIARAGGLDLAAVAADAARILDGTDDIAARSLDRVGRTALGAPASALEAADLPRLVRAPDLEADLPPEAVAAAVGRTREVMGSRGGGTRGSSAAGVAGALETLREAGGALARAGVSPRLPMESRALGEPSLVLAHAALMEGLLAEPEWLRRVLGAADPEPIAVGAAATRLMSLRATAAAARGLGGGPDPDLMSRAVGVAWPAELSLATGLGSLAAADELRARMLAAALRQHLREEHGERWFLDPAAAGLLRELWLEGGDLEPATIARELGSPGLDAGLLVAEAVERLG
jgi:hypothetical protein